MPDPQSPFVVENLTAVAPGGAPQGTYQLSRASVSPSVRVGRDARGFPVEETMPTVHWRPFLMLDGAINKVPLRTGSVFSMQAEAVAYESETVQELVAMGCIPAWLCPHSMKFQHITGGPFVAGGADCGGSTKPDMQIAVEGGCVHLQEIAKVRKADVLQRYNAEAELLTNKEAERYANMTNSIVQGVGEAIARHVPVGQPAGAARKAGLRDGKIEE